MISDQDLIAIKGCCRDELSAHSQRILHLVKSYCEQTSALTEAKQACDNALTMLDVANEVIGEVRGVCKAEDTELTVIAVRRALGGSPTLTCVTTVTTPHPAKED